MILVWKVKLLKKINLKTKKMENRKIIIGASLVGGFLAIFGLTVLLLNVFSPHGKPIIENPFDLKPQNAPNKEIFSVKNFLSKEDFVAYLEKNEAEAGYLSARGGEFLDGTVMEQNDERAPMASDQKSSTPERYSETNVQTKGIDEPDILKTNGKEIFYSPQTNFFGYMPMPAVDMINEEATSPSREISVYPYPPTKIEGKTFSIKGFPVSELAIDGEILQNGKLILDKNNLIIFNENERKIFGYDVSDPKKPTEKWKMELSDRTQIVSSRLFDDKIYLVTFSSISDRKNPCPVRPLKMNEKEISFACDEIRYIDKPAPAGGTFEVMTFYPTTGEIENKTAFAGSYANQNLYMSENGLYLSYFSNADGVDFFLKFFQQNKDMFSASVIERLEKLADYDISSNAKRVELENILEEVFFGIENDDERMRVENELENRMTKYVNQNKRKMSQTSIVKIGLDKLEVKAIGSVPGNLLNQFSMDEYENHLRIATTVGDGGFASGGTESENDVYVLDKDLKIVGSALGMGKDERIYSARFVGKRGYLVTFREIDPFFVMDLSNPKKPEVKGELKIPGYSSYLHPIDEKQVLGIGKEDNQVKVSLFDVSSAENPIEKDKYILKEYWTDILDTHHAFLLDEKHQIFFLPGSSGAYIFGYDGGKLVLKKTLSETGAKRALYIDDYLYVFFENKLVVLDQNSWERVKDLEFGR